MKGRTIIWTIILPLTLAGCGSDGDDDAPAVADDAPDAVEGPQATDSPGSVDAGGEGIPDGAGELDGLPIDVTNGFHVSASRRFDADGRLVLRTETRLDPEGRDGLTAGEFFEPDGTTFEFRELLSVDESGQLIASEFEELTPDADFPAFSEVVTYTYDASGRLISRTSDGLDDRSTMNARWDEARLLGLSERPGEFLGYTAEYGYDTGSSPPVSVRSTTWYEGEPSEGSFGTDPGSTLVPETIERTLFWDGPGRMRENRIDHDADGIVDEVTTYEYDADGNMFRSSDTDAQGRLLGYEEYDYESTGFPFYNSCLLGSSASPPESCPSVAIPAQEARRPGRSCGSWTILPRPWAPSSSWRASPSSGSR